MRGSPRNHVQDHDQSGSGLALALASPGLAVPDAEGRVQDLNLRYGNRGNGWMAYEVVCQLVDPLIHVCNASFVMDTG